MLLNKNKQSQLSALFCFLSSDSPKLFGLDDIRTEPAPAGVLQIKLERQSYIQNIA